MKSASPGQPRRTPVQLRAGAAVGGVVVLRACAAAAMQGQAADSVQSALATALELGDFERAAAVECSAALRVEAAQTERASGRREPDFASRAMTSMAIALGKRGEMDDAIAMLNAEARLVQRLAERLAAQDCIPSERAVLERCLVSPEREDDHESCRETVRNELFDLFGIWVGQFPLLACLHAVPRAGAPACQPV